MDSFENVACEVAYIRRRLVLTGRMELLTLHHPGQGESDRANA